jgi:hypothetical protein
VSLFSPPPPTETERLLALTPVCAPLGLSPAELSEEECLFYEALLEHRGARDSITAQLQALSPPYVEPGRSPGKDEIKQCARWQADYEELMLQLVQEDCCHYHPLDSEFGESLKARPLEHWQRAPGIDWRSQETLGAQQQQKPRRGASNG